MRMAASSPVWFTRRAEERKERCSGESSWIGLEVEGGVEETVALLAGGERLEEAALGTHPRVETAARRRRWRGWAREGWRRCFGFVVGVVRLRERRVVWLCVA